MFCKFSSVAASLKFTSENAKLINNQLDIALLAEFCLLIFNVVGDIFRSQ